MIIFVPCLLIDAYGCLGFMVSTHNFPIRISVVRYAAKKIQVPAPPLTAIPAPRWGKRQGLRGGKWVTNHLSFG